MNENYELYEHVYEDSSMACFSLNKLSEDLKDKDNKIKGLLDDIINQYEEYKNQAKEKLTDDGKDLKEKSFMDKMMASIGIKKEVISDNSDSSIADMLIQGISMGSIDTEKKIKAYQEDVSSDELKFVKDFLKFQERCIDKLKKYL